MRKLWLFLFFLPFFGCKTAHGPVTVAPQLYEVDNTTSARPLDVGEVGNTKTGEIADLIAPYKAQLDTKMSRVLAEIATPLKKDSPEGTLGNWMADVMYSASQDYFPGKEIAFAATNPGGLRVGEIGAGPLIVSELYELMPFDNKLVLLELTGAEVMEFIAHMTNSGGWPVSKELEIDGRSWILEAMIQGEQVDLERTYFVTTIDYVAEGGSNASMLKGKPLLDSGVYLRDVLVEYAGRATEPISVQVSGRTKL